MNQIMSRGGEPSPQIMLVLHGIFFCCYWSSVSATSGIGTPPHFYFIDPNRSERLDSMTANHAEVQLNAPFQFMKASCETKYTWISHSYECVGPQKLWVNRNGVLTFTNSEYGKPRMDVHDMPFIAPLWTWLSFGNGTGAVFYQQTSKKKILKQAKADVRNNFACNKKFNPTSVLIVTWYNMPLDPCTLHNESDTEHYCFCKRKYLPTLPYLFDRCVCTEYPLDKYCQCSWSDHPENCFCNDYLQDYYGYYYCNCLAQFTKKACDCYNENAFEDLMWCVCITADIDYPREYCECVTGYPVNYCTCMYIDEKDEDYCYCLERGNSAEYCQCEMDYYNTFQNDRFSDYFCDCLIADEALSSCMCTRRRTSPSTEYCGCLEVFQPHFDANDKDHFYVHEFCLCYAESANASECGCAICPAERSLHISSENELHVKRRAPINATLGSDLLKPWSEEHNTFQAVIITDGRKTFVIFNYESLNIQKYLPSNDSRPALVGIDGHKYSRRTTGIRNPSDHFAHEYSYKPTLYKLLKKSNVGIPGRWMYRVDGAQVLQPADC